MTARDLGWFAVGVWTILAWILLGFWGYLATAGVATFVYLIVMTRTQPLKDNHDQPNWP